MLMFHVEPPLSAWPMARHPPDLPLRDQRDRTPLPTRFGLDLAIHLLREAESYRPHPTRAAPAASRYCVHFGSSALGYLSGQRSCSQTRDSWSVRALSSRHGRSFSSSIRCVSATFGVCRVTSSPPFCATPRFTSPA